MKLVHLLLILLSLKCSAQFYTGPRAVSMGSAGASIRDIWALQINPAGTANLEKAAFEVGYVRHFLDKELSTQVALLVLPLNGNILGLNFQKYGLTDYSEQVIGINFSRAFGSRFSLGIGFSYHTLSVSQYGRSGAFTAKAGFQYGLSDKIILAAFVFNPGMSSYSQYAAGKIPVIITLGIAWNLTPTLLFMTDIQKISAGQLDMKSGLEYNILNKFFLRAGVSMTPFTQYAGFGISYQHFRVQIAVSSHIELGFSPQMSLGYEF